MNPKSRTSILIALAACLMVWPGTGQARQTGNSDAVITAASPELRESDPAPNAETADLPPADLPPADLPPTNPSAQTRPAQTRPAQTRPAQTRPVTPANNAASRSSARRPRRITRAPKNNGHFLTTSRFASNNLSFPVSGTAEFVVPGRFLVADNSSAETDDRLIFQYHYFQNALETNQVIAAVPAPTRRININQYTLGFEKAMGAGACWSLEMRLPFYSNSDSVNFNYFTNYASLGNLTMIGKRILSRTRAATISTGLGVSAPTGDDTSFVAYDDLFTRRNQAVHVAPFLALLLTPGDRWFGHGFLQVDIPTSGNEITSLDLLLGGAATVEGEVVDQTLLAADVSIGYWWYRSPCRRGVTGVATLMELHYVSTLNDSSILTGSGADNSFEFRSNSTRFDVLNLTLGLDVEMNRRTHLRAAAVVPLRDEPHRFFDGELQFSMNLGFLMFAHAIRNVWVA